jgi:hypothetical protein
MLLNRLAGLKGRLPCVGQRMNGRTPKKGPANVFRASAGIRKKGYFCKKEILEFGAHGGVVDNICENGI